MALLIKFGLVLQTSQMVDLTGCAMHGRYELPRPASTQMLKCISWWATHGDFARSSSCGMSDTVYWGCHVARCYNLIDIAGL